MTVLYYLVFIQFGVIAWLLYDKFKKKKPVTRYRGLSADEDDA